MSAPVVATDENQNEADPPPSRSEPAGPIPNLEPHPRYSELDRYMRQLTLYGLYENEAALHNYLEARVHDIRDFGTVAQQVTDVLRDGSFAARQNHRERVWFGQEVSWMMAIGMLACSAVFGALLYRLAL